MPKKEKYHFDISYDRKELKKHISAIAYREARRVTGPIYDVLITELLEDGLTYTAKHFQTEINTEDEYFRENVIRDRLMDQPTLLFDIYDKCRMAEKMALLPNYEGLHHTFNLLHQVILKLQTPQNLKYDWLLQDILQIVAKIGEKLGPKSRLSDQPLCYIYFSYAKILSDRCKLSLLIRSPKNAHKTPSNIHNSLVISYLSALSFICHRLFRRKYGYKKLMKSCLYILFNGLKVRSIEPASTLTVGKK